MNSTPKNLPLPTMSRICWTVKPMLLLPASALHAHSAAGQRGDLGLQTPVAVPHGHASAGLLGQRSQPGAVPVVNHAAVPVALLPQRLRAGARVRGPRQGGAS